MTVLKSSTAINWIIGRHATTWPSDHAAVHLLQDGTRLTPLSRWTGDPEEYIPPSDVSVAGGFDAVTAPVSQVHRLSGRSYFAWLNQLLVDNPPNPADAAFVERLSRLGISPGARLDDQPQDVLVALDTACAPPVPWPGWSWR